MQLALEDFNMDIREQLNEGSLMKNDESTTDLVLSKNFTSFQKLTGLCDYHKLIVNNLVLVIFKCHTRYGILHRTSKNIWSFLIFCAKQIFVTTPRKMAKVSPLRRIS